MFFLHENLFENVKPCKFFFPALLKILWGIKICWNMASCFGNDWFQFMVIYCGVGFFFGNKMYLTFRFFQSLTGLDVWAAFICTPSESQKIAYACIRPSNLDFWPLQTLCCSLPVSLEVWCSPSQCHASSGASAGAAEPAPTQVQDLAQTTDSELTHCKVHYTNKGSEMASGTTNNHNQGPMRGRVCPCWSVLQQGNESLAAPGELSRGWPWPL